MIIGSEAFANEMIIDLSLHAQDSLSDIPNDADWAYVELLDMRQALNQQMPFSGDTALAKFLQYDKGLCSKGK